MPQSAPPPREQPPVPGEELSAALALVNTRLDGPDGPRDLLARTAEAQAWLAGRGLPAYGEAVDAEDLAALTRLREAVRTLFTARLAADAGEADGSRGAGYTDAADTSKVLSADSVAAAVAILNAALAAAPCVTSLAWDGDGPRVTQRRRSREPFAQVLAALAADAAELLTGPLAGRLARCEAHNCIRMFIRTHAARHVCSTRCGDRVRAARHYARKRERETSSAAR